MPDHDACLGLCFFEHHLFYAVHDPSAPDQLVRIGAVDFNFDIAQAISNVDKEAINGLCNATKGLADRFGIDTLRVLLYPSMECWSTLPKLVYDDSGEREAYISILMSNHPRSEIHTGWHALSNDHFKLLRLRSDAMLAGIHYFTDQLAISTVELVSAFEIGSEWIRHASPGGSFLTVGCYKHCISVSSFILGKLRGATYIPFDHADDLPYLWLQKAQELSWMQGLHEQIQVYGRETYRLIEILQPFWEKDGEISPMNQLEKMQVQASEQTYGFELEQAYPAIMLALG